MKRIFVSESFWEILATTDGLTAIQARSVCARYIGKWINIEGPIALVEPIFANISVTLGYGPYTAFLIFERDHDQLMVVNIGDRFKAVGRITDISRGLMSVEDCEFVECARYAPQPQQARAPSVKTGRAPDDGEILSKADEMHARGMKGRDIASKMRFEPGFENAGTVLVRDLIKGRFTQTGRPRK